MEGVWRWEKREMIYLSLDCHHQNDSCIKMGSEESHFIVSVGSDGQSHRTVSTNHNLFLFVFVLGKTFVVAVAFEAHVLSCRAWRAFHFFTKKPSRECIILLKGITYVTDPLGPEWGSRTGLRLRSRIQNQVSRFGLAVRR